MPPGFDALARTDSFSVKTVYLGKLAVNIRKLTKLLQPYLLIKKNCQIYLINNN
jgi:hypothetical protein